MNFQGNFKIFFFKNFFRVLSENKTIWNHFGNTLEGYIKNGDIEADDVVSFYRAATPYSLMYGSDRPVIIDTLFNSLEKNFQNLSLLNQIEIASLLPQM